MPFTSRELAPLVEGVCAEVIEHEKELTELDRAIGDADHGLNMERGCKAVRERLPGWAELAPGALLSEAGKTLVMTVGGASGPLFGTLFMRLGQGLGDAAAITREGLVLALGEALVAVRARGRAQAGQKTLLDVLEPVYARRGEQPAVSLAALAATAQAAARATIDLRAERGRASFLGERSRGHMDPGAYSSALIICAVCEHLGKGDAALRSGTMDIKQEEDRK